MGTRTEGNVISTAAGLARRKILVLSDDARLSRVIEVNLDGSPSVEILTLDSLEQRGALAVDEDFDLVVVAMSSPSSEPVVALSKASLARLIGRVPFLIISDRPFDSDWDARIVHLDFPFDVGEFCHTVERILAVKGAPASSA